MGQNGSEAFESSIAIWVRGIIANLALLDRLLGEIPARLRPSSAGTRTRPERSPAGVGSAPRPACRRNPARPGRSEQGAPDRRDRAQVWQMSSRAPSISEIVPHFPRPSGRRGTFGRHENGNPRRPDGPS